MNKWIRDSIGIRLRYSEACWRWYPVRKIRKITVRFLVTDASNGVHWCSCPPITFSNMASVDSPHQGLFCFFSLVHSWMHKKRINICLGYDIYFNIVQAHFPMRPGKFTNRFWNVDLWVGYRELMITREMLAGPWKYDTFGE